MSTVAPAQAPSAISAATFTAFADHRRLAAGRLVEVAAVVKRRTDQADGSTLLVFDDRNGRVVDFDLRGTVDDVVERLPTLEAFLFGDPAKSRAQSSKAQSVDAKPKKRGPGRPKLGVVGREVTLLPRHWEWLNRQLGGASVTLRKLVETARLASRSDEEKLRSRDAAYRFMSAMAGNLEGFEEASRAYFAGDRNKYAAESAAWPDDVRAYADQLASAWFDASTEAPGDKGPASA